MIKKINRKGKLRKNFINWRLNDLQFFYKNHIIYAKRSKTMLKKIQQTGHEQALSKSSTKDMRNSILEDSKFAQQQVSVFWSKKSKVMAFKLKAQDQRKCEHAVVDGEHHFVYIQKKTVPSLKLVHMYPDMYPRFTADPGALKFVMNGANIMCKGLTNQFANMEDVEENALVAIYVHNVEHAVGLGITKMSTQEIRKVNEGIAVDLVHYVGDGFWSLLYQ